MAGVMYKPNPLAAAEIGNSPMMRAALAEIAGKVADGAKAVAPVDTGFYRDSIHVEASEQNGMAAANVVTDDPKWAFLEFGTSDTPVFAPLRRGLDSAAL